MNLKNIILACAVATTLTGCVGFNRDALWNACIAESEYCTYWAGDFPVGSEFVHREDDWTEYRIEHGYELTIKEINGDEAKLEHGWQVLRKVDGKVVKVSRVQDEKDKKEDAEARAKGKKDSKREQRLCIRPIVVKVLEPEHLQVGEFFKEYGQYKYEKNTKLENGAVVPYLIQENTCQDLVAEPYGFFHHW